MLDRDLAELYAVETRTLKQAVRRNIKRFPADFMFELSYQEYGKAFVSYENPMRTLSESMKADFFFDRMPIKDTWVPSRTDMYRILDRMDQSIRDNQPVYFHCWGGRGRTGTVVGCYLVRHGYASSRNVLKCIKELRRDTEDCDMPSPETSQQIDMVFSWVEGE